MLLQVYLVTTLISAETVSQRMDSRSGSSLPHIRLHHHKGHNNAQEIHPAHPFLAVPDQRPRSAQPLQAVSSQSTVAPATARPVTKCEPI